MNYEISGLISFKMYRKEFLYINVLYPRLIFLTKGRSTSSLYFSLSFAFNRLSFRRAFIVVSALHEQVVEHKSYMYTTDGNECSSFSFFFFYFFFLSFSFSLLFLSIPYSFSFFLHVHEFLDKFVSRLPGDRIR